MKGFLSPAMRECLYRLRHEPGGGVLERRTAGLWTLPSQPKPPTWTATSLAVEALISRGVLRVTAHGRERDGKPKPVRVVVVERRAKW